MSQTDFDMQLRQATAALNAGDIDRADMLSRPLAVAKRNPPRLLLLRARIAMARYDFDAADALLKKCLKLAPKEPPVHLCVAQTRQGQGRYREAIAAYDKVLRLLPEHPVALIGKAETLQWQGEHDASLALLDTLINSHESTPEFAHVRAESLLRLGRLDEAIDVATDAADSIDAPPFLKQQLWLLVGRARERQGDIDDAFEAYRRGNDAIDVPSNVEERLAHFESIISMLTTDALSTVPRSGVASPAPVFIVGMPRCGSTLLESIIDAHPRAKGLGEIGTVVQVAQSLPETIPSDEPFPRCVLDLEREDVDRIGRDLLGSLTSTARQAKRVVDKTLLNFELLGVIERLLPGASVIHCRRDPLNTCFSCYSQPLPLPGHAFACRLDDLGRVYRGYERVMDHWRDACSLRQLEVQYEELVAEPERISRGIIDFIGLDWSDRCLDFFKSGRTVRTLSDVQVNRPIYTSSASRAERFAEHLGPLRDALSHG